MLECTIQNYNTIVWFLIFIQNIYINVRLLIIESIQYLKKYLIFLKSRKRNLETWMLNVKMKNKKLTFF